jgi:uncharacterized damage-inducible protein DinB
MNTLEKQSSTEAQILSSDQLLAHWQGHRALTRRVIDAFPEDQLFTYSIGGMRTFAELAKELLAIAGPGLQEIVSGDGTVLDEKIDVSSKAELLALWDQATSQINALLPQIGMERYQETIVLFGMYEGTVSSTIFYFIDNEIHHRGQGYVYLRSLNIEPPAFYER